MYNEQSYKVSIMLAFFNYNLKLQVISIWNYIFRIFRFWSCYLWTYSIQIVVLYLW